MSGFRCRSTEMGPGWRLPFILVIGLHLIYLAVTPNQYRIAAATPPGYNSLSTYDGPLNAHETYLYASVINLLLTLSPRHSPASARH